MNLQVTNHANTRFRQRGIKEKDLIILHKYGTITYASGGAVKIHLAKKSAANAISDLKIQIHEIQRVAGLVIIEKEGNIITGYHLN